MFETIWKKIVRRPAHSLWTVPALLLWPVALLYRVGFVLFRLVSSARVTVSVPVVSVGNITVGGTGKTPLVFLLARDLLVRGLRVGIVSSGYGRQSDDSFLLPGYRLQQEQADVVGDEVRFLADQLPEALFAVDRIKTRAASQLSTSGEVDIIVIDDGFQHFRLSRDLDIVTYDAALKRHWLRLFPYGMLREPLSALRRADIIIITRARFAVDIARLRKRLARISPRAKLFHAGFESRVIRNFATERPVKYLEDKSVFLFAGVGNFMTLRKQVAALAGDLDYAWELSDHQRYDQRLLERIKEKADTFNSDLILTTGKDWVKISHFDFGRETYYLNLSIDLDPGEERLVDDIVTRLGLDQRSI